MTSRKPTRLRYFEQAPNQRHIRCEDRYLYAQSAPRHRAAIIGTGTIGQEHMRVASMLGRIGIHGIYDTAAHSMDVAAQEFAKYSDAPLKRYPTLEAACNDADVDVIFICTPNFSHFDVFETAIQSGKPIFLEKPMATQLEHAKQIVEAERNSPSFVQVGLQYRYKAPYVEARHEALDRGTIGAIRTISISEYRPPFLDKVNQWNKFAKYSGGTLVEKCCHYFDLINLFAGSHPTRVFATGSQAVNFTDFEKDGSRSDIDDNAMVIIDYSNGIHASFTLNMFCPMFHEELVLCGDQGRLVATEYFDFQRDDVASSNVSIELGEGGPSRDIDVAYSKPVEQSGHHGATFFEHVALADQLDGLPVDCASPLQGLWSIVIAAAAQESVTTGQPVAIDPFIQAHGLGGALDSIR